MKSLNTSFHMSVTFRFCIKFFETYHTLKWLFTSMCSNMSFTSIFSIEFFVTQQTFEWLFTSMCSNMILHVLLCSRLFWTKWAPEVHVAHMNWFILSIKKKKKQILTKHFFKVAIFIQQYNICEIIEYQVEYIFSYEHRNYLFYWIFCHTSHIWMAVRHYVFEYAFSCSFWP